MTGMTKTSLKCELCGEDVCMDTDDIWCACHIQPSIECVTGTKPSYWYTRNERTGAMEYKGDFVTRIKEMSKENLEQLLFFLLGVVSMKDGFTEMTPEELLDYSIDCITFDNLERGDK